jgi:hypothetical protein
LQVEDVGDEARILSGFPQPDFVLTSLVVLRTAAPRESGPPTPSMLDTAPALVSHPVPARTKTGAAHRSLPATNSLNRAAWKTGRGR